MLCWGTVVGVANRAESFEAWDTAGVYCIGRDGDVGGLLVLVLEPQRGCLFIECDDQ
jgi:hypothetical protein